MTGISLLIGRRSELDFSNDQCRSANASSFRDRRKAATSIATAAFAISAKPNSAAACGAASFSTSRTEKTTVRSTASSISTVRPIEASSYSPRKFARSKRRKNTSHRRFCLAEKEKQPRRQRRHRRHPHRIRNASPRRRGSLSEGRKRGWALVMHLPDRTLSKERRLALLRAGTRGNGGWRCSRASSRWH